MFNFAFTFSDTMQAGFAVAALVMLAFDWRRLPRGLLVAAPWLVLQFTGMWLNARTWQKHSLGRALALVILTAIFALAGLESWRRCGRPGLPWTRRLVRERDDVRLGAQRWLFETATVFTCSLAWVLLLPRFMVSSGHPVTHDPNLTILAGPVMEELTYRLGIQGILVRLTRGRRWSMPLAILVSTVMWALIHGTPWRLVELVPVGIALGWLQVRHGTEACIVAHAGHNAALRAVAAIIRAH